MFEIAKEEKEQKKAELEAKRMLHKMMTNMILSSETAPESLKLSVLVMDKAQEVGDLIHDDIVLKYVSPGNIANAETLKNVMDYLELVKVGIKQFADSTPFVKDTKEDEE